MATTQISIHDLSIPQLSDVCKQLEGVRVGRRLAHARR
jgi:hypothetical protein